MKNAGKTTRGELRATLAVVALIVLAACFPKISDLLHKQSPTTHVPVHVSSPDLNVTPQAPSSQGHIVSESYHTRNFTKHNTRPQYHSAPRTKKLPTPIPINCQSFDPNTVTSEALEAMGVRAYISQNILKYRAAGGTFRQPGDLQKIYGMDSTVFHALLPCLELPTIAVTSNRGLQVLSVDINTAGMEEWKALPGIGEGYARRIINFRDKLGGFHSIDQVSETYGLPDETFAAIRQKLVMSDDLMTIDINTADVAELAAHPYITHKQAETIVNFRNHHGNFAQVDDLMHIYSLDNDWLSRVHHYLGCGIEPAAHADIVAR